jgi:polyphosphate kinase
VSIIGRFLEHSRIWYFANDGAPDYFFGSADWMTRNFDRRVEAVAPVEDTALHPRLHSLLDICLSDNRQAWDLAPDGSWRQRVPDGREVATHRALIRDSWGLRGSDSGAVRALTTEEERALSR